MAHISFCKNNDCEKKDQCLRFQTQNTSTGTEVNFKAICKEWNNYKYFIQAEVSVTKTEDITKEVT